jgi:hypothetical protein
MGTTLAALERETDACSVMLQVTETGDHYVWETRAVEKSDHLQ